MLKKVRDNKYTPYIVIILLGIIICFPLFTLNIARTGEYFLHAFRIVSVKECIADGVFPPLINYKHMNGFGYGINIFYGIFTTYIPILISYFTNSIDLSIKIFALLSVIFSGITMYWFVHNLTKNKTIGLVSALIYMSAPYKITNIYERCALGEYVAFIFIPLVFNGLYYLMNKNRKGSIILILGTSLLIFTHTITTIYTAIFVVIFLLFNIKKIKNIFFWKELLISLLLILAITSVYTIPLIEHKLDAEYAVFNAKSMHATKEDVWENTNSPAEWFKLIPAPPGKMDFSFGIPIIFLLLITLITYKKVDKKYKRIYNISIALSILSLIMCTKLFPWKSMPHFLTIIQFAWRTQGFFILFISIVCGINAHVLTESLSKIKTRNIVFVVMIIFISALFQISNKFIKQPYERERIEDTVAKYDRIGVYNINRDYMPIKAYNVRDWIMEREDRTYINSGNATIKNENKDKLYDKMEIEVIGNVELELPYLYYLGYTTILNGEKIENYESENGMLAVKVDTSGILEVKYEGTIFEKIGYIISLVGIMGLIGIVFYNKRNNLEEDLERKS